MKSIFALTVNFNNNKSTDKLLESIEKSDKTGFDLDVIVVDNSSGEQFSSGKKNVTVIKTGKNTGFSGGSNIGINHAIDKGADYVLLINNDTVVSAEMIRNLKEVLDEDPTIGIATPKIYFTKGREFYKDRYVNDQLGRVFWFAGGLNDWDNATNKHRGVDEVDSGQYDQTEEVDFATGCCMMLRTKIFDKVDLFNEKYFLYYEDHDLCERVKKAGYRIYYVGKANMHHDNASSSGGPGNTLHDYFLTRNQMLFGMTYAPLKTKIALIRQSFRLLFNGRLYQKRAIRDFYLGKFGKGAYFDE